MATTLVHGISLGTYSSLFIENGEYNSRGITLPIDFTITNNDSIKITQLVIVLHYIQNALIEPDIWSVDLSYNDGSSDLYYIFDEVKFDSSTGMTIITMNHMFNSNYTYELDLVMDNNGRAPKRVGIQAPFFIYIDAEMTINTKPTVSSGKKITASDLAVLSAYNGQSWNNGIPGPGDIIFSSHGNKVKPNTVSADTPITAAWYNS